MASSYVTTAFVPFFLYSPKQRVRLVRLPRRSVATSSAIFLMCAAHIPRRVLLYRTQFPIKKDCTDNGSHKGITISSPYVGIIQIRLWVEILNFLSACLTSSPYFFQL